MTKILFLICIFLVIYSYITYPLILLLLSLIVKRQTVLKDQNPEVTLVISAFNEEKVIGRKLDNALALEYPKDMLEIMVVSDNSTDMTDEIVRTFADRGVVLLAQPSREGKSAGLNHAVSIAKGEIIVFSDANALYEQSSLSKMVRLFGDPRVGLVTGSTKYMTQGKGKLIETTRIYSRLEHIVKRLESQIGSCVGADGAIFAVRKYLCQLLAHDDINDFVIPLNVVKQGYRAVLDKDLFCTEEDPHDAKGEFRRQIRITNRTLRAIFRNAELINPLKHPLFSFQLISHKIMRFSVPFFLILLLPMNTLMIKHGLIYGLLFVGHISLYVSAIIGWWYGKNGKENSSFGLFYHFFMVNASILLGWHRFFTGQRDIIWNPQRR